MVVHVILFERNSIGKDQRQVGENRKPTIGLGGEGER